MYQGSADKARFGALCACVFLVAAFSWSVLLCVCLCYLYQGSADKARVVEEGQLVGLRELREEDQERLGALIAAEAAFREGLQAAEEGATRLEHSKDGGVFWSVVQTGASTRVRWGSLDGSRSNVSEKEHKGEAAASKFVASKVKEKLKGGYVLVSGGQMAVDDSSGGDTTASKSAAKGGKKREHGKSVAAEKEEAVTQPSKKKGRKKK